MWSEVAILREGPQKRSIMKAWIGEDWEIDKRALWT